MVNSSITIVTALFDIGRKNWTQEQGYQTDFDRTIETYLNYFSNLAKLTNKMIIFTSSDLRDSIEKIRGNKPTIIIVFDFSKKFKYLINRINQIQLSERFQQLIPPHGAKKPEYMSPEYVLITNLKPYFVTKAIKMDLIENEMAAWIDFGYCRSDKTINGVKNWNYPFKKDKLNCFTINKDLQRSNKQQIIEQMLNGRTFIIGGAFIANTMAWLQCYKSLCQLFKQGLKEQFVDDEQYFITRLYYENPHLLEINYLGKSKWFDLFKKYGHKGIKKYWWRLKNMFNFI